MLFCWLTTAWPKAELESGFLLDGLLYVVSGIYGVLIEGGRGEGCSRDVMMR